jgi:hypothetical protein
MSAAELAWRIQSTATLPARALVRRRPALPSWERPEWNAAARALVEPYSAAVRPAAERIAAGELRFWGHRVDIELTATDWTNVSRDGPAAWRQDPKAVWELHRLQHVLPLAAAAAIDEREEWARLAAAHLLDWIEQNSPSRGGPGWSSAYETAHRLVGWSFALPLLLPWLATAERERLSTSFARQCAYTALRPSRFSSANNHRLAELTGLLAGSAVGCADLDWQPLWAELESEAARQTYPDGGSREQASGYFLYVLEILSTASFIAEATGTSPGRLEAPIRSMLDWLEAVAGSDGEPPPVGDDAEDRLLRLDYFADRRANAIAAAAGGPGPRRRAARSRVLADSGYAILRAGDIRVVFDVGELGYGPLAAHGHADALAVLVDDGRNAVLRDSGTGTYVAGSVREWLRGTAAHNTVLIDGVGQAESRGPHLWGRRFETTLEAVSLGEDCDVVRAWHNGYRGAVHARSVVFVKPDLLVVLDRITSLVSRRASLVWQVPAALAQDQLVVVSDPPSTPAWGEGLWSPRYSFVSHAPRATWSAEGSRIDFATVLSLTGQSAFAELEVDGATTTVSVSRPRQVEIIEGWAGAPADVRAQ